MSLWDYTNKCVKIVDVDGRIHEGLVEFYTSELDNIDGVASISIRPDGTQGILIELSEDEVVNIEVTPSSAFSVASAM